MKKPHGIRLYEEDAKLLTEYFGSVQKAIDFLVETLKGKDEKLKEAEKKLKKALNGD